MPRILIYKDLYQFGEYDIDHCSTYQGLVDCIEKKYNGICPNYGNKLWLFGIVSSLRSIDNTLIFYRKDMSADYINHTFDYIVLPMANIFYSGYIHIMERFAMEFEQIRIPTYVIACGVQADSYDDLDNLVKTIGEVANRFIRTIYRTGGEFALRGHFTEEFFHKLGYNSPVVTGCPSLYASGGTLQVCTPSLKEDELKPVLNGRLDSKYGIAQKLKKNPQAVFIDQHDYFDMLYRLSPITEDHKKVLSLLIKKYGYAAVDLAVHDRMKLFFDLPVWRKYLLENEINFSYGTRIHGNIMPILCGIPSLVHVVDSRTREMAEFYHIPLIDNSAKRKTLYELYCELDYRKFNDGFNEKYKKFRNFLSACGLIKENAPLDQNDFCSISKDSIVLSDRNDARELCDVFEKNSFEMKLKADTRALISKMRRV